MVTALGEKLRDWRDRGEYLTHDSLEELRRFAYGDRSSLRLVVQMQHDGPESQRSVQITLAPRTKIGSYAFRVKLECSCWSSTTKQTEAALQGWGLAHGLALVALRTADQLPPIMEPAEELIGA